MRLGEETVKLWRRFVYAVFLTAATMMMVSLLGAIAGWDTDFFFHPAFTGVVVIIAFVIAPWVERRMPFKRSRN